MNGLKAVLIIGMLSLALSCETFTNRYGPESESTRVIYSQAGGIMSWFTGRISSCTIVETKGVHIDVESVQFSEDECSIVLGAGEKEAEIPE